MFIFTVALYLWSSIIQIEGKSTALRFGQTTGDYISLGQVDVSQITSQFSVCCWIKRRFSPNINLYAPIVLHYYPDNDTRYGFLLGYGITGNTIANTAVIAESVKDKFRAIPNNRWYHICRTWSTNDFLRVYLNGNMVGSTATDSRQMRTGGEMTLGTASGQPKSPVHTFGGDVFKLNIYNRVLDESEIRSMASDFCSYTEDKLKSIKVLKWDEIISMKRSWSLTILVTLFHILVTDVLRIVLLV